LAAQLYPARGVFLVRVMLTLLQYVAFLVLVAMSLGGFAAAVTWVFAVWFGEQN
jgi:hypothetical protein